MKQLNFTYRLFLFLGWGVLFLLFFDWLLGDDGILPAFLNFNVALIFLVAAAVLSSVKSALTEFEHTRHKG